jgi:hypothetical protein
VIVLVRAPSSKAGTCLNAPRTPGVSMAPGETDFTPDAVRTALEDELTG